jgi:hypothetical protein
LAKKRRGRPPGSGRVAQAADAVGSTLGNVVARVNSWMAQREELARDLRAAADSIMSGESPFPWGQGGKAAKAGATPAASGGPEVGSGRKRRTMSASARKRISDAQKARWAAQKAAAGGGGTAAKGAKKGKRGRKAKGGEVGNG